MVENQTECSCEGDCRTPGRRVTDNVVWSATGASFAVLMYLTVGKLLSDDPGIGMMAGAGLAVVVLFAVNATVTAWLVWSAGTDDAARRDHDDAREP